MGLILRLVVLVESLSHERFVAAVFAGGERDWR
jgi:hypothetical protein